MNHENDAVVYIDKLNFSLTAEELRDQPRHVIACHENDSAGYNGLRSSADMARSMKQEIRLLERGESTNCVSVLEEALSVEDEERAIETDRH